MMIESTIQEWIKDFEGLEKFDHAYGIGIFHNGDVISALHSFFDDINKYGETIQLVQVFEILFKYYKLNEPELKRFTLQYLPQLLDIYLNANARTDKELSAILDAFLLGLYNLEIADDNGQPKVLSFRLPSLAQSSIYHEPVSLAPASLTESALKRLEQMDSQLVRCGPLKPIEVLIAQNRLPVLTELLFVYNKHIAFFSKISIEKMCNISFKIVTQGFPKSSLVFTNHEVPSDLPRLKVSSPFLCQLLYSLYFAVFNGFKYEAVEAIEAIAMRAEYNRFNDIILLTNAIRNYLKETQTDTGPMGIGVSITSTITTTTNTTLSKSMITNASFRTKKLPDDIPIQDPHQQENADGLGAISEEKEESSNTPEIHPRRSLPRMAASFGKKTKEKIAIAVKSGSVSSIKSITKSNSILLNGGDASETDESGIELGGSDISNLALQENENTVTPYNNRKNPQINNTLDIDVSRSMQVSSV